jgi:hypothetical protein
MAAAPLVGWLIDSVSGVARRGAALSQGRWVAAVSHDWLATSMGLAFACCHRCNRNGNGTGRAGARHGGVALRSQHASFRTPIEVHVASAPSTTLLPLLSGYATLRVAAHESAACSPTAQGETLQIKIFLS